MERSSIAISILPLTRRHPRQPAESEGGIKATSGGRRRLALNSGSVETSSMWAAETLKEWHDFYVLMGTAGATLLGLLFVAVSLGAGYLTEESQSATRTFMSPVVVHFTSVFFLSAVALFPSHQAKFLAALIGATALIGAIISTYITIQVVRTDMTNYLQDYLAYGLLPGVGYLVLLAAAVSIYLEKDFGLNALAGALLLLEILNIRNAWDLMLTMVRRHHRND